MGMSRKATRGPGRKQAVLLAACLLVFVADYTQFQLSSLAHAVVADLSLSTAQFSTLLMAPMLTAVFVSVPSGLLADRFGPGLVVTVANVIAIAGSLLRMCASSYAMYLAAMLLLGCSPAALNANIIKVLGGWFDDKINLAMGAFYSSASAGIMAALATANMFPSVQASYAVMAAALAAGSVLWAICVRDADARAARGRMGAGGSRMAGDGRGVRDAVGPLVRGMLAVGRDRNVWLVAVSLGFGLASTTAFSGFFPQYLEFGGLANAQTAGAVTAFCTAGSIVGCLVGPAVCYRLGACKAVIVLTGVVGGALMLVSGNVPFAMLSVAMVAIGLLTGVPGPVLEEYPYSLPSVGERYAGSAGGLIAMVSMTMAFVVPALIAMICGDDYGMMFTLMGVCYLASVACVLPLPDIGEA